MVLLRCPRCYAKFSVLVLCEDDEFVVCVGCGYSARGKQFKRGGVL